MKLGAIANKESKTFDTLSIDTHATAIGGKRRNEQFLIANPNY